MSDPYRDSAHTAPADAPRDTGIVGDVISQFADEKAFFRELVQNSIDAGSPSIEIKLAYDRSAHKMHVSVRDRGEGMTREIVENQLLVLFRSTKENDRKKIGKFGIGFVSVLAPNPEVVVVNTVRAGKRITLHLYRDLSYELFDAGAATQQGTTVELEINVPADQVHAFVRDSELSLVRWCRHASVPIELAIVVDGDETKIRIDRPLSLDDVLVEVRRTTDDGQLTAVVGIKTGATPYTGFFNHGLTLYETTRRIVGELSVKIQDSRLGHTISRDNVRRDEHYDRALEFARELARTDLPAAVAAKLCAAAEAVDLAQHYKLLAAMVANKLDVAPTKWTLPIVDPVGGSSTVRASDLGSWAWASARTTPVTEALAAEGMPVLRTHDRDALAGFLDYAVGCKVIDVEHELTCITPVDRAGDAALLAFLHELFDAVHRPPTAIMLAKLTGARADRLAIAGTAPTTVHLVDREDAARDPFALVRRRVLVLSAEHPHVRAARNGDPFAASHLARAVLLQYDLLDSDRSHAILEHMFEHLGAER